MAPKGLYNVDQSIIGVCSYKIYTGTGWEETSDCWSPTPSLSNFRKIVKKVFSLPQYKGLKYSNKSEEPKWVA